MLTSGGSTVSAALSAGAPVLLIPTVGEQYLTGLALERMGGGLMAAADKAGGVARHASAILANPHYRSVAAAFSQRYRHCSVEQAVDRQWQALSRML